MCNFIGRASGPSFVPFTHSLAIPRVPNLLRSAVFCFAEQRGQPGNAVSSMTYKLCSKSFIFVFCIFPGLSQPAKARPAQAHDHSSVASQNPPVIADALLQTAAPSWAGVGTGHEQVSASSPAAQQCYDRGLSFSQSYDWIHAARSFNECLRLDPRLAMAYAGLSQALFELSKPEAASAMQAKADVLKAAVTPREQLRIELHSLQLQAGLNGDAAQGSAYVQALDRALPKYPSDVQLLLLRGNAAEPYAAGIGQLGGAESIKYYERVLAIEPDNAAAHHFLAHSYENTGDMASALKHAEAYQKLAPSSPHAHHMYGHGLRHTGQPQQAVAQFKLARELAEHQYSGELSTLIYDWEYRHDLGLLGAAYLQVGSLASAQHTFRDLAQLPPTNPQDELYSGQLASFFLRTGRPRDAISAAQHLQKNHSSVSRLFAAVIAGNAYLDLGQTALASQQTGIADEAAKAADPAWADQLTSWLDLLHLRLDAATGHRENMTERFKKLSLVPALPAVDSWSETLFQLEYICRVARNIGDWNAAAFAANRMLAYAPHYKGTHLALAAIARHDAAIHTQL